MEIELSREMAMPMTPYPVRCYRVNCEALAAFKIAARWSDGTTHELKTYALSCERCLQGLFTEALHRQGACRTAPGETLEAPGIFELIRGERDKALRRRADLEADLSGVE